MTDGTGLCGHTYTTLGSRVYRCVAKPHSSHPERHHFVRDHEEQDRRNAEARNRGRRNGLIVIPGERQ